MHLNADVGEGVGNEPELFPFLTACNIACGGHAGEEDGIRGVVRLAKSFGLEIGAHPSYPDRKNFGRKSMALPFEALRSSLMQQMDWFVNIMATENAPMTHIKAHGALYTDIAKDSEKASDYLNVVMPFKEKVKLYVPYGSVIAKLAKAEGFAVFYEAFMDRRYTDDLTLVSRSRPDAVLADADAVREQVTLMVNENKVLTVEGNEQFIKADTFCIHGDHPKAVGILTYIAALNWNQPS